MALPGYWVETSDGGVPHYWLDDKTGFLKRGVEKFLRGDDLTAKDVAVIRNYLRQWICAPLWDRMEVHSPEIEGLRDMIDSLTNEAQIDLWLERAQRAEVDPL